MNIKGFYLKCILAGMLLSGTWTTAWAQFQQLPVRHALEKTQISSPNSRTASAILELPFWDDFSNGQIDSMKWENQGALPSYTIGVDPPSYGVCFLDGVDENGRPYSRAVLENGEGDQLTSLPIDLTDISDQEANSVFLSFFWQPGGKGEMPDSNDFLELLFLDESGEWISIWSVEGGNEEQRNEFTQNLIQVEPEFHHENFRFRFRINGRLSGPFDTWVLDYIYLNKNRNASDTYQEDRTLTKVASSPFGKYGAIPIFDFQEKIENTNVISSQFKNLSNRFRAMEYTVQLRNHTNDTNLQTINLNTPFNPVPQANERRDFLSRLPEELDITEEEEFDMEILTYLSTGDNFLIREADLTDTVYYTEVDLRLNDTIRNIVPVRDFYAYDNGSVDYSAGINQRGGILVVRYDLENPAYIKGVSINFTNFDQIGAELELMVWDDLDSSPVFSEEIFIPEKSSVREFSYFPIDTNINLSGTFYVGFTQFTNDFVYVGLDKTNDNGEEIFFNIAGEWEQNQFVAGSLMIRPHLSLEPVAEQVPEDEIIEVKAYPNPVTEKLFLEGEMDEILVYDFYGRQINPIIDNNEKGKIINFAQAQKGMYLIKVFQGKKVSSIKILVK